MQAHRRAETRLGDARAAFVGEQLDITGRVARENIGVAVAVPIDADRRGQRAALELVGPLLEVGRRQKDRPAIGVQPAGVFHQRHAAIFVADHEVQIVVLVPIEGDRHDHLQVHCQRLAVWIFELAGRRGSGVRGACRRFRNN